MRVKHIAISFAVLVLLAIVFPARQALAKKEEGYNHKASEIYEALTQLGVKNLKDVPYGDGKVVYQFTTVPDCGSKAYLGRTGDGFWGILYDRKGEGYFSVMARSGKGGKGKFTSVEVSVKGEKRATFIHYEHTRQWTLQSGEGDVLRVYGRQMKILANLWALQEMKEHEEWYSAGKEVVCDALKKMGINICVGRWDHGGAFSTTRSSCCAKARHDVDRVCAYNTPGVCTSCCDYKPCNAYCLVGDYFCDCTMAGRECGNVP